MRLVIGGPTRDTVPASFAVDLVELYTETVKYGPWDGVTVGFIESTYVHVGRETFLEAAIEKAKATHVLWLDTDMAIPPDTAIRLAKHNQTVVACNCVMRDGRGTFTAVRDGQRIDSTQATGLEAVDSVGLAVMLMRTDIMPGFTRPWFRHGLTDAGGDIGEDVMFCRMIRRGGHQIMIDHDLSKEVGHIGLNTFRPNRQVALSV